MLTLLWLLPSRRVPVRFLIPAALLVSISYLPQLYAREDIGGVGIPLPSLWCCWGCADAYLVGLAGWCDPVLRPMPQCRFIRTEAWGAIHTGGPRAIRHCWGKIGKRSGLESCSNQCSGSDHSPPAWLWFPWPLEPSCSSLFSPDLHSASGGSRRCHRLDRGPALAWMGGDRGAWPLWKGGWSRIPVSSADAAPHPLALDSLLWGCSCFRDPLAASCFNC